MFDNVKKPKAINIVFRVSQNEAAALKHICDVEGRTRSNALRRAILRYRDEIDARYSDNSSGSDTSSTCTESP